ncbi:MAG: TIGR02221 family CRISPR-associated protein [Prevotella sp.]|uniref:TIGR02221 family CRISPR-associated protein n=1 Tax=Prevotella sp. TaxID=59823 RepID=UPI002A278A96|nr:TIGR02221 family CRISPR-associated protein [Prevotella sp.]MDD7318486.1 TIGR02221 family CRISPR-associated protein [Prevotellaceae bacterium]MDY4020163.1 TIGR02221 family CRISPR-associated protein [Prevotella sp.]
MKVLISFIGHAKNREYRPAKYMFPKDETVIETTFIAKALKEYHNIDKLILIGTTKSMWEEVYRNFKGDIEHDPMYWDIGGICEKQNAHSNPDDFPAEYVKAVENAIGNGSRVVMIKYGITEEEIRYNIKKIFSIEGMLNTGDEIYLDITHSFRSLPIYIMNCMAYISNVSRRNIKIESISYGMFEASEELGDKTPVVEMKSLMDVYEWISGAYSFSEFGNTYKISKLINESGNKEIAGKLLNFAETNNLNMIADMREQVDKLNKTKWDKEGMPEFAKLIVKPVVNGFTKRFNGTDLKDSLFQIKLAQWHLECHNYGSAAITLCEGLLTSFCEAADIKKHTDKDIRDFVKGALHKDYKKKREVESTADYDYRIEIHDKIFKTFEKEYIQKYWVLQNIRNTIAHNIDKSQNNNKASKSSATIIEELKKHVDYYIKYYDKK